MDQPDGSFSGPVPALPLEAGRVPPWKWAVPAVPASLWIAAAVALVFIPGLFGPFVLDDHLLEENPRFRSFRDTLRFFWEPVVTVLPGGPRQVFYRPLSFLSFRLDGAIWGANPFGFHLTNLLFHLGSTLLLHRLLRRWWGGGSLPGLLSVLWAVFPVQAEPVVYISCRHDVMFLFFYLLALDCYTGGDSHWRGVTFSALAVASFLAKEMAVSLPAAALLFDLSLRKDLRPQDRPFLSARLTWPLLALGLVLGIRFLVSPLPPGGSGIGGWRLVGSAGWEYLEILSNPFAYSVDRSRDVPPDSARAAAFFLGASALAALVFALVRASPPLRKRFVLFSALWALVASLPVSNFLPLYSICADRYLYLPLVGGLSAVAGALGPRLPPLRAVACAALIALGVITAFRTQFFASELLLYRASLATSPGSPLLLNNYGMCLKKRGERQAAAAELSRALEIDPGYQVARFNLGVMAREEGKFAEAERWLGQYALAIPRDPEVWLQLSLVALESGRDDDTRDRLREAEALGPLHLSPRYHLVLTHLKEGKRESARKVLEDLSQRFWLLTMSSPAKT